MPADAVGILDAFFSRYLGCELAAIGFGETRIVPSPRRFAAEVGYGPIFAIWALMTRGRCAVSLQQPLAAEAKRILGDDGLGPTLDPERRSALTELVCRAVGRRDVTAVSGPILFCTRESLRRQSFHPCRRVGPGDVPALVRAGLHNDSLAEAIDAGFCFAAWSGGEVACVAATNPIDAVRAADGVADIGINTAAAHRRQGFGKTALSALTAALLEAGCVPVYAASDHNEPSIRTATSVGYVQYAWQFRVQVARQGGCRS